MRSILAVLVLVAGGSCMRGPCDRLGDLCVQLCYEHPDAGAEAAPHADEEPTLICKFTRLSSGQTALLSASPQLCHVLSRAFSLPQPFTIGSIDASTDMFRVCSAQLMLKNGYCVLAGDALAGDAH